MYSLKEMDKFLERFHLSKLNQEEIANMNRPIASTDIETVIKKTQQNKCRTWWFHRQILSHTH